MSEQVRAIIWSYRPMTLAGTQLPEGMYCADMECRTFFSA